MDGHLRLSAERIWLYGGTMSILGLLPLLVFPNVNGAHWQWSQLWNGNWAYFIGGGATAGTHDLLGPRHVAWELTHGFSVALPWVYPPAFAWVFLPMTHVSLGLGFALNAAVMLGACVASGAIAARIYGLPLAFSLLAVLAWQPAVASVSDGENASLALLLSMAVILGLVRGRQTLAGTAVGLLLFKPTDAAAFVLLLLLRRQWCSLAVVALAGAGWYFAGVPATAGDWNWPYHYVSSLSAYLPHQDFAKGIISISGLSARAGLPAPLATGLAVAVLLAWCPVAARVSALEAASFGGLIAVATSPHANSYEAALVVPALFYIMTHAGEPWRTRIVITAYCIGALSILRWVIAFDPVSILVALGTLGYLTFRYSLASRYKKLSKAAE